MVNGSSSPMSEWRARLTPPPPDTEEGAVLAVAAGAALVYLVLLIADYDRMTSLTFDVTSLSLVVSLVSAFGLAAMLGSDVATFQRLELELARTVLAYVSSGTPPQSDAPLAGVWRAHVAAAEESRRMSRSHAYSLGLFTAAGLLSLGAILLWGLGAATHTHVVLGLAMFVEWFGFTFLVAGAVAVAGSIGYAWQVSLYELIAPRRWRRNSGRQMALEGAVSEIPWLAEFSRGARESRMGAAGPSVIPSWRE